LVITLISVAAGRSRRRNQAVRESVAVAASGYNMGQPSAANYSQGSASSQGYPSQNYPSAPYGTTPPASYGPGTSPSSYGQGNPPSYGQGNPPPPPTQFSNYTYPPAAPASSHTTCVNGHALQPNETYCRVCGASRA
jgi:hypothetical protein